MEDTKLGKCCCCEQENDSVSNLITLEKKTLDTKGGWGCFVCGLPSMGAVAVLCDDCLEKWMNKQFEIKFACLGYPGENRRIELVELTEVFEHDMTKHPEENEMNFIETEAGEQDFIKCRNCKLAVGILDGRCANCGEQICLMCGCTDSAACDGGCSWVRPNVCSACDPLELGIF